MYSLGAGARCPLCRIPVQGFMRIFLVEPGRDEELRLARQQAIDAEQTASEERWLAVEANRLRIEQAEARLAAEVAQTAAEREAADVRTDAERNVKVAQDRAEAIVREEHTRASRAISEAASAAREQTAARIVAEAARY
jgi:hypothetical protein